MEIRTQKIPSSCDRCGATNVTLSMSMFNTDMICFECERKEKRHPKYKEALRTEYDAIKNGNFNFKGVGKPSDL